MTREPVVNYVIQRDLDDVPEGWCDLEFHDTRKEAEFHMELWRRKRDGNSFRIVKMTTRVSYRVLA